MKVRSEYNLMQEAIQRGIEYGYNRAFKHEDEPSADKIKIQIENSIMTEICEVFSFNEYN